MKTRANLGLVSIAVSLAGFMTLFIKEYLYVKSEAIAFLLWGVTLVTIVLSIDKILDKTYKDIKTKEIEKVKQNNKKHWINKRDAIKRNIN